MYTEVIQLMELEEKVFFGGHKLLWLCCVISERN